MPVAVKDQAFKGPVRLDVIVGNAQLGDIIVFLNSQEIRRARNEIKNFPVGNGEELRGQILTISTSVLDIRDETDETIVTATVQDATTPVVIRKKEDAKDKIPVNYFYVVRFK